jgi:integrase
MSIYQRENGVWYINITAKSGKRIRESTGTTDKQQAQEYHDKIKHELWRVERTGDKPRYTWAQAVPEWAAMRKDKPSFKQDMLEIRRLDPVLGKLHLDQISTELVDRIKRQRIKDGAKERTVNATLQCIRSVMRHANEWGWIDTLPRFKLLTEPKRRIRFLSELEEARLLKALPGHLVPIVKFSLMTGLRKSNVTGLTWKQIDIAKKCAWIYPDQAKAGNAIPIPLNSHALTLIRSQIGKHLTHVFTFRGEPIEEPAGRAWRETLVKANIKEFRWHDIRHTWASRMIQRGVPLHALMELGGWTDIDMVRKYAHFGSEHLLEFAEKSVNAKPVDNLVSDTNLSQVKSA